MKRTDGFTIMETLVAITLFAIIMVAVLIPMLGNYRTNQRSTSNLNATARAQQTMDQARSVVVNNYNVPANFTTTLTSLGVTCTNVGLYGNSLGTSCDTVNNPPMRRLTLTQTVDGQSVTVNLDVRP